MNFFFKEWELREKKNMIKLLVNVVHSALQLLNAVKNDGKAIKHCVIVYVFFASVCYLSVD